jgi:uncharacterized repeat protein (TIGR03833 family)
MAVPSASSLRPGVLVDIVLKANQRSGILTRGTIANILTRGDHPRGIKVRLQDGQIGRVQKLVPGTSNTIESAGQSSALLGQEPSFMNDVAESSEKWPSNYGSSQSNRQRGIQDDFRYESKPVEERSLEEFFKVKPSRKNGKSQTPKIQSPVEIAARMPADEAAELKAQYPGLDLELIVTILEENKGNEDDPDNQNAKNTLKALCQ